MVSTFKTKTCLAGSLGANSSDISSMEMIGRKIYGQGLLIKKETVENHTADSGKFGSSGSALPS